MIKFSDKAHILQVFEDLPNWACVAFVKNDDNSPIVGYFCYRLPKEIGYLNAIAHEVSIVYYWVIEEFQRLSYIEGVDYLVFDHN
jgi:hypothetical protein